MQTLRSAIQSTVPITLFNKGQAGKIFSEVRKSGARVVVKNNAPECVLLSPEDYLALIDAVEDAELLTLAEARMDAYDAGTVLTQEDIDGELGFSEQDIADADEDAFE